LWPATVPVGPSHLPQLECAFRRTMHHWSTLIGKTSNTSSCQLFTLGFISCRHFKLSSLESVWWYFKPLLHIPLLALLISVCSGEPCTTETHRLFVRQNFSHSLQVISCHISFPQSASFLSALYTIQCQAFSRQVIQSVHIAVICSFCRSWQQSLSTNWCNDVNHCLRQLVPEVAQWYNIRLWRQRRGLYNPRSRLFGRDGVHVDRRSMNVYFNTVRYAVLSAIRHHFWPHYSRHANRLFSEPSTCYRRRQHRPTISFIQI